MGKRKSKAQDLKHLERKIVCKKCGLGWLTLWVQNINQPDEYYIHGDDFECVLARVKQGMYDKMITKLSKAKKEKKDARDN